MRKKCFLVKMVTNLMINEFKIKKDKLDFMGYSLQKDDILEYHHLIIPKREGGPISRENGAILYTTSHRYLHLIEYFEREMFEAITSEMIDENIKGYISEQNLLIIDEILNDFEIKHKDTRNAKGKEIIKPEYKIRLVKEPRKR